MFISLFSIKKELITIEGRVEMDDPWQLCRTIGPLLKHSQGGISVNRNWVPIKPPYPVMISVLIKKEKKTAAEGRSHC